MGALNAILKAHLPRGPTALDWATIESSLRNFGSEELQRDRKFLLWSMCELFELDIDTADNCITDGGNDRGIDAVYIDHDERQIHLVSSKVTSSVQKSMHNFPSGEVDKIGSFVDDLMRQDPGLLGTCNGALAAQVSAIWDIYQFEPYELVVHLCSNQDALVSDQRDRLVDRLAPYKAPLFEHHLVQLAAGVCRESSTRRHAHLKFIEQQRVDNVDGPIRSVIGYVCLADLYEFLKDPGTGEIDRNLFHVNVRYHLGLENPVNKQIRATLHGNSADKFLHLNNGIVIVCERLLHQVGAQFPVDLVRPQIVNGCQTVHEIFGAMKEDPDRLADVPVLVRITETKDKNLVEQIALATNSQSRIATRDLKANDLIQEQLEYGLRHYGYYYRRKRGENNPVPSSQVIDARRAGQLLTAYSLERPDRAKTASQTIFTELYGEVFDPNVVTPGKVVSLHRLYTLIEARKTVALKHLRSIEGPSYAEEWIVEGTYHLLFVVRLLCDQDEVDCYDYVEMSERLDDAVALIDRWVRSENGTASYRLFRSTATNSKLRDLVRKTASRGSRSTSQLTLFD